MSRDKLQLLSPLFLKYQSDFEKNPRSRVFAPLAEAYRKLGMTDKAMEILSQGIRFHPTYVMGYLGLAFCYFDLRQYNLAYSTLRPLIESNRDNLRLQKLFADVCLGLAREEEALETFKYLLFINPRDKEVADQVAKLEKQIEDRYRPTHRPIIIPEKELSSESGYDISVSKEENSFDDWVISKADNTPTAPSGLVDYDQWNVKKSDEIHNQAYEVHLDLDENQLIDEEPIELVHEEDNTPLVTHTLVDLYCGQGHIEKALEVLEKILLLNPNDQKTIKKIKEIKALAQSSDEFEEKEQRSIHLAELTDLEDTSEEDGRRHLMSLIDEKLGPVEVEEVEERIEKARRVEEKLTLFLKKIQKRALDYQSRL